MAFADAGCRVEAVCPADHPLLLTRRIAKVYPFRGWGSAESFRSAIEQSRPDLVIPCDELAILQLHHLYRRSAAAQTDSDRRLCVLIERSLGDPRQYDLIESRSGFLAMAAEEGVAVPETTVVETLADLEGWLAEHPLPAVIKADGTSGGEGVRVVRSREEALQAFRRLRAPLATPIVAKRTLIDRDPNLVRPWLRRRERSVSIQPFLPGHDANIAAACWKGELLASVSIEVLRTGISKGPAAIVRILPDGEMATAARKVVRRLGYSGLCGLDFMVHEETGISHLIEINARATQTGHLPLGPAHDLQAALAAVLSEQPIRERKPVISNEIVALFPLAWQTDPSSTTLKTGYHDVPWEEPRLVRAAMAKPSPINYPNLVRLLSRVRRKAVVSGEGAL